MLDRTRGEGEKKRIKRIYDLPSSFDVTRWIDVVHQAREASAADWDFALGNRLDALRRDRNVLIHQGTAVAKRSTESAADMVEELLRRIYHLDVLWCVVAVRGVPGVGGTLRYCRRSARFPGHNTPFTRFPQAVYGPEELIAVSTRPFLKAFMLRMDEDALRKCLRQGLDELARLERSRANQHPDAAHTEVQGHFNEHAVAHMEESARPAIDQRGALGKRRRTAEREQGNVETADDEESDFVTPDAEPVRAVYSRTRRMSSTSWSEGERRRGEIRCASLSLSSADSAVLSYPSVDSAVTESAKHRPMRHTSHCKAT